MTFITTAERVGMEKGLAEGLEMGREEGSGEPPHKMRQSFGRSNYDRGRLI